MMIGKKIQELNVMCYADFGKRLPDIGGPDEVLLKETVCGLLVTVMTVAFSIMSAPGMAFIGMAVILLHTDHLLMMVVRNNMMRQQDDTSNEKKNIFH
jgi:multisubunit Na+/H+ antiporter MnhB subunit